MRLIVETLSNSIHSPLLSPSIRRSDLEDPKTPKNSLKKEKIERKIRVLMVEDSLICQIAQKNLLEDLGCIVEIADTGCQGIDMFNKGHYQAIVLDINLPDISGLSVSKVIRSTPKGTLIPIIGVSSQAEMWKEECLAAGYNEVISKDTVYLRLESVLREYFPIGNDH